MIMVKRYDNTIEIKGHADYAPYGEDIVCASVSSIITTCVNCIMNIDNESISYKDNGDMITIKKINSNNIIDIILNTMIEMLKDLESKYNKNIKIESEE